MHKGRISLILTLLILAVLVTGLGWTVYSPIRQDRLNRTLIAAIKQNDTKKALTLLEDGADPNARDEPSQHLSLWRLLLDKLRGRRPAPSTAPTALLVCTAWHYESGGRIYDDIGDIPLQPGRVFTCDIPTENLSILKGLLDKGANVNVTDARGRTPLFWATQTNGWETDTPTEWFKGGRKKTIQLLLDYGANLHPDQDGITPLEMTIQSYNIKDAIIVRMLNRGENINYQDFQGDTPLICAVWQKRVNVIQMLLDHHADVNIKNRFGSTALSDAEHFASTRTGQKIIQMLKQAGAKE